MLKPPEILEAAISASETKAAGSFAKLFTLGILAGAFIAFAAGGSSMVAFNLLAKPETFGLGRCLAGFIFPIGLILVICCGAELFTGNCLMLTGVYEKKIRLGRMLRNWVIVYAGNLVGSVLIAWLWYETGLFGSGAGMLGAVTVKIAAGKASLAFWPAFCLGILCNWLVCLAVGLGFAADSMAGKILGIFVPIWLFVASGFEHSVANMYYIPAGIFAKANETFAELSGVTAEALGNLTWGGFFVNNLIPVTLGNIVGGGLCVATAYWFIYKKTK